MIPLPRQRGIDLSVGSVRRDVQRVLFRESAETREARAHRAFIRSLAGARWLRGMAPPPSRPAAESVHRHARHDERHPPASRCGASENQESERRHRRIVALNLLASRTGKILAAASRRVVVIALSVLVAVVMNRTVFRAWRTFRLRARTKRRARLCGIRVRWTQIAKSLLVAGALFRSRGCAANFPASTQGEPDRADPTRARRDRASSSRPKR